MSVLHIFALLSESGFDEPLVHIHTHSHTLSHTHTQYLRVLGATHYSTQGWYNGWVFESLLQLGCGLKGDKRDLTKLAGCHK